jgi:polysaccharide pyruvyl transferase WcaK-like protein
MEDLDIPGWDLGNIPDDPEEISKIWWDFYQNSNPLSSEKIQSLINEALLHRQLLKDALG